jgi:nicotinate-nucleotide pyrophosphorylase (carboxylating)
MMTPEEFEIRLKRLIKNALEEDTGCGDYTTLACIDKDARGKAILKVKERGKIAGIDVAEKIFSFFDYTSTLNFFKRDGDDAEAGEILFQVEAKIGTILSCERLVLNCMQRMSGIATLTSKYVEKLKGYSTKLIDTRKTTPNFRLLEKEAVRIGGGYNHRFGLFDMILIKDNHIDYCGGIENAINKAWNFVREKNLMLKIEVETRNLADVERVLKVGKVDRIMLDNFSPSELTKAIKLINRRFETEASGGIHFNNLEDFAKSGVDFISSGAITHHAVSLDLSLKAVIIQ